MRANKNQAGFTLIEIVIAVVIMAGLSMLTAQAIRNSEMSRSKVTTELEQMAVVRDVLRVIERDINLAFHHRDFTISMLNEIDRQRARANQAQNQQSQGQPGQFQQPPQIFQPPILPERKLPKQLTGFVGALNSLHLTTLSNVRTTKDAKESEQAEVGYFLKDCRGLPSGPGAAGGASNRVQEASSCLFRRRSPILDGDVTEGGAETLLVDHVQTFQLRYFGPDREDWVEAWRFGEGGDEISRENFPYAVEVTLAVHNRRDPKSKRISMTMVAPIRFPNNPPKRTNETGTNQNQPLGTRQ